MKKKINLPNKITLFRIVVVLMILCLFLFKEFFPNLVGPFTLFNINYDAIHVSILGLFILGVVSDFLDGYIARKRKLITTFGKFLDPIADKLLVNTMFIILTALGQVHWLITVIMVSRDTIVDMIRFIMVEKNVVIAASNLGKLKTATQMLAIILVLVLNDARFETFLLITTILPALISFISGVDYFNKSKKVLLADLKQ